MDPVLDGRCVLHGASSLSQEGSLFSEFLAGDVAFSYQISSNQVGQDPGVRSVILDFGFWDDAGLVGVASTALKPSWLRVS